MTYSVISFLMRNNVCYVLEIVLQLTSIVLLRLSGPHYFTIYQALFCCFLFATFHMFRELHNINSKEKKRSEPSDSHEIKKSLVVSNPRLNMWISFVSVMKCVSDVACIMLNCSTNWNQLRFPRCLPAPTESSKISSCGGWQTIERRSIAVYSFCVP